MNLYHISRGKKTGGYDSYASAVVCASSYSDSKIIHPSKCEPNWPSKKDSWMDGWVKPENVISALIGTANESMERGVICASFNAG